MRGMTHTWYCFKTPVWEFAAHLFCDSTKLMVIFARNAEDWDFDRGKRFVHGRLDAGTGGTQRIRKSYRIVSEPLGSDVFLDFGTEQFLTSK